MKSKIIEKISAKTYRKLNFCVDTYSKFILTGIKQRFHYYFDLKSFNIGFGFCKTTGFSGWKYMLSFDLTFFSFWIYFIKIDRN